MKVTNKTHYDTRDLHALLSEAMERDGIGARGMRVEVRPTRGESRGCSGFAWYNSRCMVVRVPVGTSREVDFAQTRVSSFVVLPDRLRDDLARTALHEAAHCRGVRHEDMSRSLMRTHSGGTDDHDVSWAAAFAIRAARPAPRAPQKAPTERRHEHAAKMLARAERRLKLATTLAKKWRAKVRYYERRAAAQTTE